MSCTFYRWNGGVFGDYWCDKKDCRVDSNTYYKYCRDYNYSDCPIYKMSSSSGCFITTIVCEILGKEDNDQVLTNLRTFRENILKPQEKYHEILIDYDNIGPVIASCIANDPNKEQMAIGLYEIALSKISKQIEEKENDKVIENYINMVLCLINYYQLKHIFNFGKDNNYDIDYFEAKTAGHGRVLKKQKNKCINKFER